MSWRFCPTRRADLSQYTCGTGEAPVGPLCQLYPFSKPQKPQWLGDYGTDVPCLKHSFDAPTVTRIPFFLVTWARDALRLPSPRPSLVAGSWSRRWLNTQIKITREVRTSLSYYICIIDIYKLHVFPLSKGKENTATTHCSLLLSKGRCSAFCSSCPFKQMKAIPARLWTLAIKDETSRIDPLSYDGSPPMRSLDLCFFVILLISPKVSPWYPTLRSLQPTVSGNGARPLLPLHRSFILLIQFRPRLRGCRGRGRYVSAKWYQEWRNPLPGVFEEAEMGRQLTWMMGERGERAWGHTRSTT